MRKWLVRLALGGGALLVVIVLGTLAAFLIWRVNYIDTLKTESDVISTAVGDVEYAVVGEETPYLYVHGAPGGYDQDLPTDARDLMPSRTFRP